MKRRNLKASVHDGTQVPQQLPGTKNCQELVILYEWPYMTKYSNIYP